MVIVGPRLATAFALGFVFRRTVDVEEVGPRSWWPPWLPAVVGHEVDAGMIPTCSHGIFLPAVCLIEMFIERGMQRSSRISVRWPKQSCIISSS